GGTTSAGRSRWRSGAAAGAESENPVDGPARDAVLLAHLAEDRDIVEGGLEAPRAGRQIGPHLGAARPAVLHYRHVRAQVLAVMRPPREPGEPSQRIVQ